MYPFQCEQADDEDFKDEQNLVARLVHMMRNDDLEVMFKVNLQSLILMAYS